ncbi:MAG: hypothetical protein WBQ30_12885 [Thermoanaerobaculia bacterium]
MTPGAFAAGYRFVKNSQTGAGSDATVTVATQIILPSHQKSLATGAMRSMAEGAALFQRRVADFDIARRITMAVKAQLPLCCAQQCGMVRFVSAVAICALLHRGVRMATGSELLGFGMTGSTEQQLAVRE